ncbi:hypothetical protein PoB_006252400 [Plakobranchus ocellatus]|uniref:Uncharacterized protein n=1 Tax=Plakobranchus ocellatus TaxID=259542 RepID=A0AAV4CVU3_9GAST|nr:hypothetical protein PoB_006252400 [Plakobranchus ocellatus]
MNKWKMKWYGHVTQSHGLAKTFLQGTEHGMRRRGRPKKRWENNISEWRGLKLHDALREAENRERWRRLVGKPPMASQRSRRLRD